MFTAADSVKSFISDTIREFTELTEFSEFAELVNRVCELSAPAIAVRKLD
jgi:hypothetical protein